MIDISSTSFEKLKEVVGSVMAEAASVERKPAERDKKGRVYATGKRKSAVARVWIKPGKGNIVINGKPEVSYFGRSILRFLIAQPFVTADRMGQYDVWCTVSGSGSSGQAGAIRHGISKALQLFEPDLRSVLKSAGFLTRDSRRVERKKCGLHGARRGTQFSKR